MCKVGVVSLFMLVVISITQKLAVHAGDSDSIVNERIPLKAKQLESHWKVNCEHTLSETLAYLQNENYHRETEQKLSADLKKCGYIYNVADSIHFKPEPDFLLLLEELDNLHD